MQTLFLDWLRDGWQDTQAHVGQLPTGSGKSAIARALQIAVGAHVITPSNVLIDQYMHSYPAVNYLKGKVHYTCFSGLSCTDWIDTMQQPACGSCPYTESRDRAAAEPTFFNPLSLYYFRLQHPHRYPAIVVDEAHQLGSMIQMVCEKKFRQSMYKWDDRCLSQVYLIPWMRDCLRKLAKLSSVYEQCKNWKRVQEIASEQSNLGMVLAGIASDPQNYAIYIEDGLYRKRPEKFLVVRPVRPPVAVVRRLLDCDKLILISGTMFPTDIEDLAGDQTVRFIDLPSPIPAVNRPILYRPVSFPVNHSTDPAMIAFAVEKQLALLPRQNTIIHVSYALAKKLAPHFRRPILTNTALTKTTTLERFKREGGVWLAAGCAEGLDLHDDLCRLNIIPHLSYPQMGDPVVQKRRALPGGADWYDLETLKIAVQQAGRSTRHETDRSTTIVLDPQFSKLVARHRTKLPRSFVEACVWR